MIHIHHNKLLLHKKTWNFFDNYARGVPKNQLTELIKKDFCCLETKLRIVASVDFFWVQEGPHCVTGAVLTHDEMYTCIHDFIFETLLRQPYVQI